MAPGARRRTTWLGLALLIIGLAAPTFVGCEPDRVEAAGEPDARLDRALRLDGREGHYVVELVSEPSPPATGELFRIVTRVRERETGRPVEGARVTVDAQMPHHGHGMTTRPSHRALGGGTYETDGMKLHMPGRWVLSVRIDAEREDEARAAIVQPPAHRTREAERR